jgi:hypothetical protein
MGRSEVADRRAFLLVVRRRRCVANFPQKLTKADCDRELLRGASMSKEREPQLSVPMSEQLRALVEREAEKADRSLAAQVRVIISDWAASRKSEQRREAAA